MSSAEQVGIRALKDNASAVVSTAASGEVITITDRGRPVAVLGPLVGEVLVSVELIDVSVDVLNEAGRLQPAPA